MPGSICDILPSAAAVLGLPDAGDRLGLAGPLDGVRRIAVVLVDGLGEHLLPLLAPHAPFLAEALAGEPAVRAELACTFPSTTPTSLVSLGTGVEPGEHGVLGFTLNVPGTDRVLTHILWRDDPPPRQWQPVPTWYERIVAAGLAATAVLPSMFAGSGLTDAAYRGARFHGVGKRDDYAGRVLDELAAAPGLVYGYTAALDTSAHVFGIASPEWARAASDVDRLLSELVAGLPPDAALLVTADHGGLDVGPAGRLDIAADPQLAAGVRVVAGEPRVRYLHARPGAAADVLAAWRAVLGERAVVLSRSEAIESGRFGPVPASHEARLGDVVVICRDDLVLLSTGTEPPEVARLVGFHGAETAAETAIPLIGFRR